MNVLETLVKKFAGGTALGIDSGFYKPPGSIFFLAGANWKLSEY